MNYRSIKQNQRFSLIFCVAIVITLLTSACKKFIEIDLPKNQQLTNNVFSSDKSATSAVVGIYSQMITGNGEGFASGGPSSLTSLTSLSSDDLISHALNDEFFLNSLNSNNSKISYYLWAEPYQYVYSANLILESLEKYSTVSEALKKQLTGEAKFIRAFIYFNLVNMYGPVPLHSTTDYKINSKVSRSPINQVYDLIISDLLDAEILLSNDYSYSSNERTRPNKWAAKALLARVYLYTKDYVKAEQKSSEVISNSLFSLTNNLQEVFLKNSSEAIWQLKPVNPAYNTWEGFYMKLTVSPVLTQSSSLSPNLIKSFSKDDRRKFFWIDSLMEGSDKFYFPKKYNVKGGNSETLTEYSMVLRLAELYLIRSESRLKVGNNVDAKVDLELIRKRAGLDQLNREITISDIVEQRRLEFFTEWGHRWFDIKRLELTDQTLSQTKSPNWTSDDSLYPIPLSEINSNPNITQNNGY
ncbi:RagB/SusD family nutrient uptake outer membrane protein [Pedobacter metabolipauper]|uniref:RagB/SusD domain-containing protein n=1 Tax=Pedobacter metabolipauper TaxID=425513 RepID=A0A4R6SSV3_9SPHI|nr:RagB/SusD family nutrient uptake outer membrane protein [Pedobacter metabolipauper]TDQ08475.1 RagB/SusD domain-containing protein [Pedobacter metabolipauper]